MANLKLSVTIKMSDVTQTQCKNEGYVVYLKWKLKKVINFFARKGAGLPPQPGKIKKRRGKSLVGGGARGGRYEKIF